MYMMKNSKHSRIDKQNALKCFITITWKWFVAHDYGWAVMEGLLQPNWFDGPAIPHNLFREEEFGNLATTDKLHEPSETESSDEEEWSEDSDDSGLRIWWLLIRQRQC